MPKGVYIGDIDPNNTVASVREVRRNILFKLLLWDSIVLSDSQFLTDPRIAMMMSSFNHKFIRPDHRYAMEEWHGGFELLLQSGLVEVAHRTDAVGEVYSIEDVWTSMNKNSGGRVPFLPETSDYAEFLDQTAYHKRTYNLARISEIFKNNLQKGFGTAFPTSPTDDTDLELGRMIREQNVLFRELLQFIKDCLASGKITQARYDEIYKFVYGCYHINVPTVANCYVCTDYEKLPVHLELGNGVKEDKGGEGVDQRKLRPTWALDPDILDLLPIGSFLKVRSAVQPHIDSGLLLKYNTGDLSEEEEKQYVALWEDYTSKLEQALRSELMAHYMEIDNIVSSAYVPRQQRVMNGAVEIVANTFVKPVVSAAFPLLGSLVSAGENARTMINALNTFIMVHRSGEPMDARAYKNEMLGYMTKLVVEQKAITYRIEK